MQIKLLDLDNGREVVVEMDGRAHVVDLIQRLRELGVIRPTRPQCWASSWTAGG